MEYTKDGACLTHLLNKTIPAGKYKFVDDDTMELTISLQGKQATVKYRVKVTQNELVTSPIDVPNPKELKYKRVK